MILLFKALTISSASLITTCVVCSCGISSPENIKIKTIVQSGNKIASLPSVIMLTEETATIGTSGNQTGSNLSNNIKVKFNTTTALSQLSYNGEITDLRQNNHRHFGPFTVDGKSHTVKLDNQSNVTFKADLVNKDGRIVK